MVDAVYRQQEREIENFMIGIKNGVSVNQESKDKRRWKWHKKKRLDGIRHPTVVKFLLGISVHIHTATTMRHGWGFIFLWTLYDGCLCCD